MNPLNLSHLKYFTDSAREGGVSQSARKNFVTQSAVSRAISSLERELGVDLILHGKNHFQLTEAGETVAQMSDLIFEKVTQLRDAASQHAKSLHGPLRFACNPAIASYLIAPVLVQIELKYPGIRPLIELGNTDQVQRLIDNREVDFGIVVNDGEVDGIYDIQRLYKDELYIVRSPKHRKVDPFENLIISRNRRGGLSQKYFRAYEKVYGTQIKPKLLVASWQVLLDLAIAGYGSALLPGFVCKEAIRSKKLEIVSNRVKPVSFELCTIVSRDRALPKNVQAIFEHFAKN